MDYKKAIEVIKNNYLLSNNVMFREALDTAIKLMEETVEEENSYSEE